jgi:hypothetical protein
MHLIILGFAVFILVLLLPAPKGYVRPSMLAEETTALVEKEDWVFIHIEEDGNLVVGGRATLSKCNKLLLKYPPDKATCHYINFPSLELRRKPGT